MDKFTNDMAALVEKIRSSAGTRHSSLRKARKDTKSMLAHNRRKRGDLARSLAEKTQALAAERDAALCAARSNTQVRLGGFCQERGRRRQQCNAALQQQMAELRQTVGAMMSAAHAARNAVGTDIREAERIWRKGAAKTPRKK